MKKKPKKPLSARPYYADWQARVNILCLREEGSPESKRKLLILECLLEAYKTHDHAFLQGCGKETMLHWVEKTKSYKILDLWRIPISATDIREVLVELVKSGAVEQSLSFCGYKVFEMKQLVSLRDR